MLRDKKRVWVCGIWGEGGKAWIITNERVGCNLSGHGQPLKDLGRYTGTPVRSFLQEARCVVTRF